MPLTTPEAIEAAARVDTVHWVGHVALLAVERYRKVLEDRSTFEVVFPGIDFANPRITHTVEGHGELLSTTKNEILMDHNHNLFKAWQILSAVTSLTSILDWYLREVARRVTGKEHSEMGIFSRFKEITGIPLSDFAAFLRLRHYYELRNISLHNLGIVNERFKSRTADKSCDAGAYVFHPHQISEYREILVAFFGYVDGRLASKS